MTVQISLSSLWGQLHDLPRQTVFNQDVCNCWFCNILHLPFYSSFGDLSAYFRSIQLSKLSWKLVVPIKCHAKANQAAALFWLPVMTWSCLWNHCVVLHKKICSNIGYSRVRLEMCKRRWLNYCHTVRLFFINWIVVGCDACSYSTQIYNLILLLEWQWSWFGTAAVGFTPPVPKSEQRIPRNSVIITFIT